MREAAPAPGLVFLDAARRTDPDLVALGSHQGWLLRSLGPKHLYSSTKATRTDLHTKVLPATFKCCRESVYSWHRWLARSGETGGGMGDIDSKIAGLWAPSLKAGAAPSLTMAALLLMGPSALAQENRGTEQQRVACTPDVFRLCSGEIPNVDRIVSCLRRERSQLSAGCRQVFEIGATASRAALNNGTGPRHAPRHHFARHRAPGEYEKSDIRE